MGFITMASESRRPATPSAARRYRAAALTLAAGAAAFTPLGAAFGDAAAQAAMPGADPPTTVRPLAAARPEYRINAGDELEISVWGEERMQRTVRVLPDGTFAFPLAGTVAALDRTAMQISADIRERIAGNYRTTIPDVSVSVRSTAGMNFFVVGKVRTPGSYASGRAVDVLQALSMAGGLADFADVKHAVILRQTPNGQVVEPIKLAKVLKGARSLDAGTLSVPLPTLRSGDVLVVP